MFGYHKRLNFKLDHSDKPPQHTNIMQHNLFPLAPQIDGVHSGRKYDAISRNIITPQDTADFAPLELAFAQSELKAEKEENLKLQAKIKNLENRLAYHRDKAKKATLVHEYTNETMLRRIIQEGARPAEQKPGVATIGEEIRI